MKRAILVLAVLGATVAGVVALGAGGSSGATTYKIVLDNAFGLVKGADFKVGGVAVGAIGDLDVERETARALVEVEVNEFTGGFGGLRESAECTVKPQSLIGEYFIDCQPGEQGELLESGGTVPVEQTRSPIPPDLVLNVMRRPIAERFRIIFSELGIGFAARGDDVQATIQRAIPALGATNDVLAVLAEKRQTLASLSRESGQVLQVLGRRREDVGDFVVQARNAAAATAVRREELAESIRRFPAFLAQLEPTMRDLGTAARLQAPALADLRAAAPSVTALLGTLPRFAEASEPAVDTLGDASRAGRTAVSEARSLVDRVRTLGAESPEPANNLDVILDHLDNRRFAVEPDPDSPGGKGYTGLEAPLQYIYDQSLAINIFDQRGYALKLDINAGDCREYTTAEDVNASEEGRAAYERCNQNLGPNQPGLTTPDPSAIETRTTSGGARDALRGEGAAGQQDLLDFLLG
jgi:ABC-type transporter Mla subunit MlaD